MGIYKNILRGKIQFPQSFDKDAKSLVKHLLVADLSKRYGNLKDGTRGYYCRRQRHQEAQVVRQPQLGRPAEEEAQAQLRARRQESWRRQQLRRLPRQRQLRAGCQAQQRPFHQLVMPHIPHMPIQLLSAANPTESFRKDRLLEGMLRNVIQVLCFNNKHKRFLPFRIFSSVLFCFFIVVSVPVSVEDTTGRSLLGGSSSEGAWNINNKTLMESYSTMMSSMGDRSHEEPHDDDDQLSEFIMDDLECKRVSTAPAKPLSDLGRFKREKEFTFLEQFVVTANQMIHKTYDKYDLDSEEGQRIFKRYLGHIESLCEVRRSQCSTLRWSLAPATTDKTSATHIRCCIAKGRFATSLRFGTQRKKPSRTCGLTAKSSRLASRCSRLASG